MLKALAAEALTAADLVTQHMPPTFTAILAEHLQRATGLRCAEAVDGEALLAGRIYVAPGRPSPAGQNRCRAGGLRVRLTQDPPENFCRPVGRSDAAQPGPLLRAGAFWR